MRLDDRPGALAELAQVVAGAGGNIMHIDHARTDIDLAIDEAWVQLQVETKGSEHCRVLVERLQAGGFYVG
ncbi:hypothetical protein GCM10025865_20800 [Paraoerskovia sediminicola]|uniref:ACT domain-containing protein n=1 Tax=Paraoerskovia sediminicola TaxID=1138587 RepID=A0ABM8G406_9CELL|nr:hypothetical protein GCM10025865_20800 [Paraoerskovia sediminicola]